MSELTIDQIAEHLKLDKKILSAKAIEPTKDFKLFNNFTDILDKEALNIAFFRVKSKAITYPEVQEINTPVGRKYFTSNVFSQDYIKERAKTDGLSIELLTTETSGIGVAVLYLKEPKQLKSKGDKTDPPKV